MENVHFYFPLFSHFYIDIYKEVKKEIQKQRISVVLNANSSMICLYWNIGRAILKKQEEEGWGAKVITAWQRI